MCYINIHGRVVERNTLDTETKKVLAHFAIDFKEGASAYIPLDTEAEDRLHARGLPTLSPHTFTPNEEISIPIDITQAIALGILDVRTVEKIEAFPTVYPDPDWTYWHRLKLFFKHYTRYADAPCNGTKAILYFGYHRSCIQKSNVFYLQQPSTPNSNFTGYSQMRTRMSFALNPQRGSRTTKFFKYAQAANLKV